MSARGKESLEFNDIVVVLRGEHEGVVGCYDDDDDRAGWIIVYPSTPLVTPYIVVRRNSVRKATVAEAEQWKAQHENDLAGQRAVNTLRGK
jgi:hypothetical protein